MTRHQERMQSADIASLVIDFGRMGSVDRISLDSKRSKQLGDYLEAILVDSHAVIEHVRYLQQGLGSRALPHGALSEERRVGFLDVGAVALSSVELLGVLLNPVELARLHDAIEESLPPFFAASALAAAVGSKGGQFDLRSAGCSLIERSFPQPRKRPVARSGNPFVRRHDSAA